MYNKTFILVLSLSMVTGAFSQRTRPEGAPPADGRHPDWMAGLDANHNGKLEADEFQAAIDRTFADLDRNGDGVIESSEVPRPPMGPPPPMGETGGRPGYPGIRPQTAPMPPDTPSAPPMVPGARADGMAPRDGMGSHHPDPTMLPPFFFMDKLREAGRLSRADFERAAKDVFASMDKNGDGVLTQDESRPPHGAGPEGPPPPPNAMFIAAELRFGDRLVKDQPFSADTIIEDTRRLFDGSTVTKRIQGAIYRDAVGRTRREQPLEMVGGFNIVGENNKPTTLVFINDFAANSQYFLDLNNKIARRHPIGQARPPRGEGDGPNGTSESLGKKTIEGVAVEGTKITFEIPAGHIGNEKPIQVVTENWFSPELQMIVWSRHLDPLSGEHIFRLVNIRRSEPSAELFTIPAGFRVEN